jgi:hypothetical protein
MKTYTKIIIEECPLLEINYDDFSKGKYKFKLYDKKGTMINIGYGYSNFESIRKCLPKEWENEDLEEYFVND